MGRVPTPWAKMMSDEEPQTFAISSTTIQNEVRSPLVPPYCSERRRERKPCFPKASTKSKGNSPVASIFAARGWTILWAVFSAAVLIICLSFSITFILLFLGRMRGGCCINRKIKRVGVFCQEKSRVNDKNI